MQSILKSLRVVADPHRVRILLLLDREELSVAELLEILAMGQSTLSTHLSQLKHAGLVEDRRTGKNIFYRIRPQSGDNATTLIQMLGLLRESARQIPETATDTEALALVLRKRQDKTRAYFDELAGRFGKEYVPGRSWKGLAELFLNLLPALTVADLGAGEGTLALMLARQANRVIAVDNSEKMVAYGTDLAQRNGVHNLEYRRGDLEELPIDDDAVDLAVFSHSLHHAQHPARAVAEAHRILKPGGRVAILDLAKHHFEEARALYADVWLGFSEAELVGFLKQSHFGAIETSIVYRETEAPKLETLLAMGTK